MLKTNLPVLILSDSIVLPSCELKLEIVNSIEKKIVTLAESYFNGYLLIIHSNKKK